MLKLKRKPHQSVIIDDDIKITVLSDNQGTVILGIEAPDHIEIWRGELYQQVQYEKNNS